MTTKKETALIKRINRVLAKQSATRWWRLRVPRGVRFSNEVGAFYVHDGDRDTVVYHHVDPRAFARDLGLTA